MQGDIHGMVYAMKLFVPEYKSNHSVFEKIDREIETNSPKAVELATPETEKYY